MSLQVHKETHGHFRKQASDPTCASEAAGVAGSRAGSRNSVKRLWWKFSSKKREARTQVWPRRTAGDTLRARLVSEVEASGPDEGPDEGRRKVGSQGTPGLPGAAPSPSSPFPAMGLTGQARAPSHRAGPTFHPQAEPDCQNTPSVSGDGVPNGAVQGTQQNTGHKSLRGEGLWLLSPEKDRCFLEHSAALRCKDRKAQGRWRLFYSNGGAGLRAAKRMGENCGCFSPGGRGQDLC